MWIPFLFIFLFSTGFPAAQFGVVDAGPFVLLLVRSLLTIPLLLMLLWFKAGRQGFLWGNWPGRLHQMIVGMLLHGAYLGGVFAAIQSGMAAGLTALLVGMHPLVTALLSKPVFGVQLSIKQWSGFFLGALGVILVVGGGLEDPTAYQITGVSLVWCAVSIGGISFATLWQKKIPAQLGHVEGLVFQYLGALLVFLVASLLTQDFRFHSTWQLWLTLGWLVFAISIGAIWLLMIMLERGEAHQVARLFFLIPPLAALQAWLFFGEQWNWVMLIGASLVLFGLVLDRQPKAA